MPLHPYQFYRICPQPSPISHMFVEVKTAWKCIASRECYCSSNTFPRTRFLLTVGDSGVIKRYLKNNVHPEVPYFRYRPMVCMPQEVSLWRWSWEEKSTTTEGTDIQTYIPRNNTPRCRGFSSCAFFLQQVSWTSFNGWGTRTIVGGGLDLLMGIFYLLRNDGITIY